MSDHTPDVDYENQGPDGSEPSVRFAHCPKCGDSVALTGPDTPAACPFCGSGVLRIRTNMDSHHQDPA